MDPPESELCAHMKAYLDGEIEAFDALYTAFAGRLRGYLLSQCRDATLADDLLQETFMQIHRSRRTYQPGRPVTPWVYAIARHVYLMKRRSAGRRVRFEEALAADSRASVGVEVPLDQSRRSEDRRQRISQLVREQREEFVFATVRLA
jgi:RNA polymerase sigma-70 factor (ECF subfamily)